MNSLSRLELKNAHCLTEEDLRSNPMNISNTTLNAHIEIITGQLAKICSSITSPTITSLCTLVRHLKSNRVICIQGGEDALQVGGLKLQFCHGLDIVAQRDKIIAYVSPLTYFLTYVPLIAKGRDLKVLQNIQILFDCKNDYKPFVQNIAEICMERNNDHTSAMIDRRINMIKSVNKNRYVPLTHDIIEITTSEARTVKIFQEVAGQNYFEAYAQLNFLATHENRLRMGEDLLQAVSWLHKNNIVHRDIKIENVLTIEFNVGNDIHAHLLLSDFEGSVNLNDTSNNIMSFFGSIPYLAPEMLFMADSTLAAKYFPAVDIKKLIGKPLDAYGVGTVFYFLNSTKLPSYFKNCQITTNFLRYALTIKNDPTREQEFLVYQNKFHMLYDKWFAELKTMSEKNINSPVDSLSKVTARLLNPDPTKRMTIEEALKIIREIREKQLRVKYSQRGLRNIS
jgi:serine/threonine protein kinase